MGIVESTYAELKQQELNQYLEEHCKRRKAILFCSNNS